jgi:hypothetical protein
VYLEIVESKIPRATAGTVAFLFLLVILVCLQVNPKIPSPLPIRLSLKSLRALRAHSRLLHLRHT